MRLVQIFVVSSFVACLYLFYFDMGVGGSWWLSSETNSMGGFHRATYVHAKKVPSALLTPSLEQVTISNAVVVTKKEEAVLDEKPALEEQQAQLDNDTHRPPLEDVILDLQDGFTGEHLDFVDRLLHFAILGHAKTASSFHIKWLTAHPEIMAPGVENYLLRQGKPAALVKLLYEEFPAGSQYKRGYKAPTDIANPQVLEYIGEYWPHTKLIVGVRHPIRWFESYYNFRVRHGRDMPPAENFAKPGCVDGSRGVCVRGARFHEHLSLLGKTNHTDPQEAQLLSSRITPLRRPHKPLSNKIFMYDMAQIYDANETRHAQYRLALSNFLGLESPLEPVEGEHVSHNKKAALDICDDQHDPLRSLLMENAIQASLWIRTYFLASPDVVVSNREHFEEVLKEWMTDPCEKAEP